MNIELLTTVLKIVISTALIYVWVVRYDNIISEFRAIMFFESLIEFSNNIFSKLGKTHKIMLGIELSDSKDILKLINL